MKIDSTPLKGLYEIQSKGTGDARGRFTRLFCERELAPIRPELHFTQINLSETKGQGTVRGLHYQMPPAAEAKLIRCLRGRVFDVAVDVRAGSPTFLQWHALELADDNDCAIFIPEGFAHGFQALANEVQLLYMHTAPWTPSREAGLRHDDPRLAIAWPRPITVISDKDRAYRLIDQSFTGMLP
jgi:dTDP-4-dehydrorhamnose 3,5-epimerase